MCAGNARTNISSSSLEGVRAIIFCCCSSVVEREESLRSISLNLVRMRSIARKVCERRTSKFSMGSSLERAIFRSRISEVKRWAKKRGCLCVVVRRTVRNLKKKSSIKVDS